MNAIQSFFARHGAVPADNRGPQYDRGSDDAILIHAHRLIVAWDTSAPEAQAEMLPDLKDLRRETWKRAQPLPFPSESRRKLNAAWYGICQRIGFGGDEKSN